MWNGAIHKQRRARNPVHPWSGDGYNAPIEGTKIENIMAQILGTIGIEGRLWSRQWKIPDLDFPFSAHLFDFAIPRARTVIECDGCYVHSCPECYPGSSPRVRDRLIDESVRAAGWRMMRFWEHDIKTRAAKIRESILVVLE